MANAPSQTPSSQNGLGKLLRLGIVGLLIAGAGWGIPALLKPSSSDKATTPREPLPQIAGTKTVLIPFGDVVANLDADRPAHHVRLRIVLVVDQAREKEVTKLLQDRKAVMQTWLNGYLSERSFKDVSEEAGINRLHQDILDQFNEILFPSGSERLRDLLFDEFVVQ
jgi:flagellar basal body-associated protein FliL